MTDQSLYEELCLLVGKEGQPITGLDEVCKQMIRHWCSAVEDKHPLYTNEDYARKSEYGSIISPPMMTPSWACDLGREDGLDLFNLNRGNATATPLQMVFERLEQAGFLAHIAVNNALEFIHPLFPGDRVTMASKLKSITPEKQTRMGSGHFVTLAFTYLNQRGELVCNHDMTFFKFKPA